MKRTIAILALLLAGCDPVLTEILVVVDTDLAVPAEIDAVRVEVTGTETMTATGNLTGADRVDLPRTVGVVREGGELGPITVRVVGSLGGTDVIERRAVTSFIEGRTLVLPMFLARRCQGVDCPDTQTCERGACVSATIDPEQLAEYGGTPGRIDAGCTATDEICNGTDEDCDGAIDEDFDLDTDPLNCGACLTPCVLPNSLEGCAAGECTVESCLPGFGDCNADPTDGCETVFDASPEHCGGCGMACPPPPNASASCVDSTCGLGACDAGFGDCDADPANGCETTLDSLTDCGACGMTCTVTGGTPTCASGTCEVDTCDAGLGDCDADPTDCESTLDTLTDCGACGMTCDVPGASETCASGTCELDTCDAGFGDCNFDASDGCERPLTTLSDCGSCFTPCIIALGTGTCATGTCEVASCNANRGDCNSDPSDGCETDLRFDEDHCGTCGMACPAGQTCRPSGCG